MPSSYAEKYTRPPPRADAMPNPGDSQGPARALARRSYRCAGARAAAFDSRAPTVAIVGMGPKGCTAWKGSRPIRRTSARGWTAASSSSTVRCTSVSLRSTTSISPTTFWSTTASARSTYGMQRAVDSGEAGAGLSAWYQAEFPSRTPAGGSRVPVESGRRTLPPRGFCARDGRPTGRISVRCLAGEVVDIEPVDGGYGVHLLEPDGERSEFAVAKVLLATGHSRVRPGPEERNHHGFAHRHAAAGYIPFAYPSPPWMPSRPAPGSR